MPLPCNVILGGHRSFINKKPAGWPFADFQGNSQAESLTKVAKLNFEPAIVFYNHACLGQDPRTREHIKRRRRRLVSRVGLLIDIEHCAFNKTSADVRRDQIAQATQADVR